MSDQTNCDEVEAEECDAYEENQEEPVAMIEESPPDVGQDGLYSSKFNHLYCSLLILLLFFLFWSLVKFDKKTKALAVKKRWGNLDFSTKLNIFGVWLDWDVGKII